MPRIMGIGNASKLSKKHKPKRAGSFKGLGVVLEGSALKSKRYGGVGAAKKRRGRESAEMTAVLGPRVKRRAALIQIGPGRPGQQFRIENTDVTTTLHPIRGSGRDVDPSTPKFREMYERGKLKGLRGTLAEHTAKFKSLKRELHSRMQENTSCQGAATAMFLAGRAVEAARGTGTAGSWSQPKGLREEARELVVLAQAQIDRHCSCKK